MIYKKKPYLTLKHLLRRQDWLSGIQIDIDIRWGPEFSIDSPRVSETKLFEISTSGYVKTLVEGQMGTSLDSSYNVYLTISRVSRNKKKNVTTGSNARVVDWQIHSNCSRFFFFYLERWASWWHGWSHRHAPYYCIHLARVWTFCLFFFFFFFFFFPLALDASLFASLNCELWVGWI